MVPEARSSARPVPDLSVLPTVIVPAGVATVKPMGAVLSAHVPAMVYHVFWVVHVVAEALPERYTSALVRDWCSSRGSHVEPAFSLLIGQA